MDLYCPEVPKPTGVWEAAVGHSSQTGVEALRLDLDMEEEMRSVLKEPSLGSQVVNQSSPFKVASDIFSSLFQAARLEEEEELLGAMKSSKSQTFSLDLKKVVDMM